MPVEHRRVAAGAGRHRATWRRCATRSTATSSGLLGLVGIEADPLSSREHILLANLIETSWTAGRSLDLATLVGQVQPPPMRKLGVFELDAFFPPADRTALAMRAQRAAGLAVVRGVGGRARRSTSARMLRTPDGKPCAAIVSIAHLSDEERQFVVALLLAKVVTWMRQQTGTTDLRALVYMDEVAGYVPPTANPPTKKPIMMLMKQARAFGVGVVLSTQNPVDVDYKAHLQRRHVDGRAACRPSGTRPASSTA